MWIRRCLSTCLMLVALSGFLVAQAAPQRVAHPTWGMSFVPPSGWQMQQQEQGYILAHGAQQRLILIVPHTYTQLAALKQAMARGEVMHDESAQFTLQGSWKDLSKTASMSTIKGTLQGENVAGATAIVVSPTGSQGVMLFSLGQPGTWNAQGEQVLKSLATSIQFKAANTQPVLQQLQTLLKGKTLTYSKSHFSGGAGGSSSSNQQATLHLCSDGRFTSVFQSTASVSGGGLSSYSGGTPETLQGTWKVATHQGQTTLIMTSDQGGALYSRLALEQGHHVMIDGRRWTVGPGQACR